MIRALRNGRRWTKQPFPLLDQRLAAGQITFHIRLLGQGNCLVTGDHQLFAEVARNRDLIGGAGVRFYRHVVGSSLLTIDGPTHRTHRKSLHGHFFRTDHAEAVALTEQNLHRELDSIAPGSIINIHTLTERITLRTMIDFLFPAIDHRDKSILFDDTLRWLESLLKPAFLFARPLRVAISDRIGWGRFVVRRDRVVALIRREVERAADAGPESFLRRYRRDALACGMNVDEIVWECVSLLLFGHDTTTVVTSALILHLHRNPAVLARLRAARDEDGRTTLVAACVSETLRLSPPIMHLTRVATRETRVGDNILREGQRILPCIYMAHRNPAVFPDPEVFDPDRFLGAALGSTPDHLPKFSFIPFGLGDRLCVGKHMAQRQLKLIANELTRRLEGAPISTTYHQARKHLLWAPAGGVDFRVSRVLPAQSERAAVAGQGGDRDLDGNVARMTV
jgi:hypothetical protein